MIAKIELAILESLRLAGESGRFPYVYRTLATYPENFNAYLKSATGQLRAPAAWVVFLGISGGDDIGDDNGFMGEARFALVLAAQNLRDEQTTRHGTDGEPGSYLLAQDAARLLSRNDLSDIDADIEMVRPLKIESVLPMERTDEIRTARLSLFAIALSCTVPFGQVPLADEPFDLLHIDWDIPAHGNVVPPLPAAVADARDDLEIVQ